MRIALYILGSIVGLLIALCALYVYNRDADFEAWLKQEREGGGS